MSGLVMLLPHGYEGQGPEHSSARLERYLQLCAEDNLQVVNCTTPANYFHALRRQVHRNFRKPLIVMTPKSLLRHKLCVSRAGGHGAGHLLPPRAARTTGTLKPDAEIRRVVLCSGKVYYDLFEERAQARHRQCRSDAPRAALSLPGEAAGRASSPASRRPRWSGARRSRATWAPGPSSQPEIEAVLESMGGKSRASALCRPPGRRRRRPPGCCAAMSRSRPLSSTRRSPSPS